MFGRSQSPQVSVERRLHKASLSLRQTSLLHVHTPNSDITAVDCALFDL
jgi:hypothetical protein